MPSTFRQRLDDLRDQTHARTERITGSVVVDQIYAKYQHEDLSLNHPRGGKARYLADPLMANYERYLQHYAATVIEGSDGGLGAMRDSVEDLAGRGGVETFAPREFGDLRASGHPRVLAGLAGERVLYDRSPRQRRLTEDELRAKARLRKLPPQLLGWIWWHVMHHDKPPPRRRP